MKIHTVCASSSCTISETVGWTLPFFLDRLRLNIVHASSTTTHKNQLRRYSGFKMYRDNDQNLARLELSLRSKKQMTAVWNWSMASNGGVCRTRCTRIALITPCHSTPDARFASNINLHFRRVHTRFIPEMVLCSPEYQSRREDRVFYTFYKRIDCQTFVRKRVEAKTRTQLTQVTTEATLSQNGGCTRL